MTDQAVFAGGHYLSTPASEKWSLLPRYRRTGPSTPSARHVNRSNDLASPLVPMAPAKRAPNVDAEEVTKMARSAVDGALVTWRTLEGSIVDWAEAMWIHVEPTTAHVAWIQTRLVEGRAG